MRSIILKIRIQLQTMYCTFHVANPGQTNEDATLGWFWMCRTDYREEEKDNEYTAKVNSVNLIGKRSTKMPKSVQEFRSRQDVSSKAIPTPIVEVQPSKKKITSKEPVTTMTTTHGEREKICQPTQEQGRGESKSSMATSTYQEKGKAKVGSMGVHQVPRQLIQDSYASSSSTIKESSTKALPKKWQGKVYQPKYPSPRAQQRRQS